MAYRYLRIDPKVWVLTRVIPVGFSSVLLVALMLLIWPGIFLETWVFLLLLTSIFFFLAAAVIWPKVLWDRQGREIDDELHLFIIRIGVLSLSSSTRLSIFEIASREKSSNLIVREMEKVNELAHSWNVSLPQSLRIVAKQSPSRRFGDFIERMAYAIESDEDPKLFFKNEQEAVMEEFKSRYSTTLDRTEVVREVYISMVSVTMFLNVMLVVLALLVGINHYLMSFLIVFIFAVVEIVLWFVINGTLPRESIWYRPKRGGGAAAFNRRIYAWTAVSSFVSVLLLFGFFLFEMNLHNLLPFLAIASTPLLLPGFIILREEKVITRRDDNFGAFIRTMGATAHTKGGNPLTALKRIRWHDFGALTGPIRNLYDRLNTRINSEKAWSIFVRETRSDLISQFLFTYREGIKAGGNPKEVSSLVSSYYTSISSLRKRRYLMADNFAAILYGLTIFISAGLFMIYQVVLEMMDRLGDLGTTSEEISNFQGLVLLKDVEGLGTIMLISIVFVIILHVVFSADAARRFKGGHPMIMFVHGPLLLWTAAISGYISEWAVGRIL